MLASDELETLEGAKRPINIYIAPEEHTPQQRQRDKAERSNQRKQEKAVGGNVDEMAELANMLQRRQRCSILAQRKRTLRTRTAPSGRISK